MLVPELMSNLDFSTSKVERPDELFSFKYNNVFLCSHNAKMSNFDKL